MRPEAVVGLAAALYGTAASALASYTTGRANDIKLHWGFPESTVKTKQGDIYFRVDAPTSYAWVGVGVGRMMREGDIYVVHANTTGGVTVSRRAGEHHRPPMYAPTTKMTLLPNSTVANGRMVAQIRVADYDIDGHDVWMCAWDSEGPYQSDSRTDTPESFIHKHDGTVRFTLDEAEAKISSTDDIFSVAKRGSDSRGTSPFVPKMDYDKIGEVHGIIMSVLFLGLYPLGALIMPVYGNWFFHAVEQCFAYLVMWVGFALGVIYASYSGLFGKQAHTRMGMIVVVLLSFQPVLGYLHHIDFKKHNRTGLLGRIHSWHGRGLMVAGVVNGGLGLSMTGKVGTVWFSAYVAVAVVVAICYVGFVVYGVGAQWRLRNRAPRTVVVETVSGPALRLRSR